MIYCLDTSIIIDILRGDSQIKSKIDTLKGMQVCITPVTLAELFKGAYLAKKQGEAIRLVEEFSESAEFLEFTKNACKIFGQKNAELTKQGKKTQEADLMIGSIALANNAILITRNEKDFANIEGLKFEAW